MAAAPYAARSASLGVVALKSLLRAYFRDNRRCTIAFSDIDCEPPGKMSREEFLGEVQYLANWPDEINLLDDGVRPACIYRSPCIRGWNRSSGADHAAASGPGVVALSHAGAGRGATGPEEDRVVDRDGVLLPRRRPIAQLPTLTGKLPPPTGHPANRGAMPVSAAAAGLAVTVCAASRATHSSVLRSPTGVNPVWRDDARCVGEGRSRHTQRSDGRN